MTSKQRRKVLEAAMESLSYTDDFSCNVIIMQNIPGTTRSQRGYLAKQYAEFFEKHHGDAFFSSPRVNVVNDAGWVQYDEVCDPQQVRLTALAMFLELGRYFRSKI